MIHRRDGRVEIYDTDASGLIFYGAPTRWFADAEQQLYDTLGIRWPLMESEGGEAAAAEGPSAPTRSFEIHLDGPLRFRERYVHEVWVSHVGRTSFTFGHRISVDGDVRIRGTVRRVFVVVAPDGTMEPADVPAHLRDAVVAQEP